MNTYQQARHARFAKKVIERVRFRRYTIACWNAYRNGVLELAATPMHRLTARELQFLVAHVIIDISVELTPIFALASARQTYLRRRFEKLETEVAAQVDSDRASGITCEMPTRSEMMVMLQQRIQALGEFWPQKIEELI